MAKITYENKDFLNENAQISNINKVTDTDLNEIKTVVNENDENVGILSNLNTTDKSSLVNAINCLLPVTLFEGVGDTSITLNDNLANYKRIKIYYYQTAYHDTSYSSVEVYEPNGKNVELSFVMGVSDNSGLYANNRCYLLNGTNVTKTDGYNARFYNSASNWAISDAIRISKIIGYKN